MYSAPFSSAHLVRPRLIVSSVPRLTVSSGRADKQTAGRRQGGRASRRSALALGPVLVFPSPVSPSPSSRLSCRMSGAKGVSFPSALFPHPAGGIVRFPVPVAGQGTASARPRSHHGKQAGKGDPFPFRPSYRRAGSHRPTPLVSAGEAFLVAPSSARRASKQDGGLVSSARLDPVPLLVSAPWLILGPSVNGRNGK